MSIPRRAAMFGLLLVGVPLTPYLAAAAEAGAAGFVAEFANKVLDLVQTRRPQRELQERLRPLAHDAFDVPRIARFVLARYWRGMSEAEQAQFTDAFEDSAAAGRRCCAKSICRR